MKKTKSDHNNDTSNENEEVAISKEQTNTSESDNTNDTASVDETSKLLSEKDKQIADLSDKFMRLAAEYDNFRRRTQKEKDALYTESVSTVSQAWLPVVDNIERALNVSKDYQQEEAIKIRAGIEMILQQSKDAMASLGISEVDALKNSFDPNSMEAIMHVEDETVGESIVLEVFEKGYRRGDKVLRHAVVKVAN